MVPDLKLMVIAYPDQHISCHKIVIIQVPVSCKLLHVMYAVPLRCSWMCLNLQGGMLVFEGEKVLFSHKDPSTSAHADLQVRTILQTHMQP